MSKTKAPQVTEQLENLDSIEEFNEYEMSDEEIDAYFEDSKSHTINGVFDNQNSIWSAVTWRRRKLSDDAFRQRMGRPISLSSQKMLIGENSAKKLAELWCKKNCRASDIENFLKNNPVDSAQYLIAILDHFETNGISKGVVEGEKRGANAVRIGIASGGGKANSEKSKKGIVMNRIKKLWLEELERPVKTRKTKSHFAVVMQYRFLDTTAELLEDRKKPILKSAKQIAENCTKWENARDSENSGRAA
ncbi:MAG: hypothetical protein Q7K57_12555 [Burkholderiaceae bacterium]|nr:hypothetical protein [Burkholderiaceae bacterium]